MSKIKTYVISILIPLLLGGAVGLLTSGSMNYNDLRQPPLSPPGILFPIAWSILYALMGVSYAQLKLDGLHTPTTRRLYYIQLAVNLLWTPIYFVLRWRLVAFFWIVLLLVLVIAMAAAFYRRKPISGLLQIPYVLWVCFATYLNLGTYLLNR